MTEEETRAALQVIENLDTEVFLATLEGAKQEYVSKLSALDTSLREYAKISRSLMYTAIQAGVLGAVIWHLDIYDVKGWLLAIPFFAMSLYCSIRIYTGLKSFQDSIKFLDGRLKALDIILD